MADGVKYVGPLDTPTTGCLMPPEWEAAYQRISDETRGFSDGWDGAMGEALSVLWKVRFWPPWTLRRRVGARLQAICEPKDMAAELSRLRRQAGEWRGRYEALARRHGCV